MKSISRIVLLTLAATGLAAADLPKKAPLSRYSGLWMNSPFTSKPAPPPPVEPTSIIDDYALGGVSPVGSGYRVTLFNKKNPEERLTVESGNTKSDFQILEVTRKAGDPLGTVVKLQSGSSVGTVEFDEKLLVLAAPPAAKAHANRPGQPGQPAVADQPGIPGQPGTHGAHGAVPGMPTIPGRGPGTGSATPQPRPRVVPPPTTGAAGAPPGFPGQPPSSSGGRSSSGSPYRSIRRGGR